VWSALLWRSRLGIRPRPPRHRGSRHQCYYHQFFHCVLLNLSKQTLEIARKRPFESRGRNAFRRTEKSYRGHVRCLVILDVECEVNSGGFSQFFLNERRICVVRCIRPRTHRCAPNGKYLPACDCHCISQWITEEMESIRSAAGNLSDEALGE
jgi:hypothetical protein